jgi:predicted ATPase
LTEQKREIFSRDGQGTFFYGSERIEPDAKLGLRTLMDKGTSEPALRKVATFLQRIAVYHDLDLWHLRWQGSNTSEDRILHTRGINALAVLRRWHQERINHHRYQFVVDGLAAAFPNTVTELDFVEAGNTLVARIYQPGQEWPSPLATEANGVLQLLVLFCDVASAESESVVAIDEPENSLHPYALRAFLRRTSQWARQHHFTVLLATHSTVLLDEQPHEQVYVMKANESHDPLPTRLDKLCNRDWLEGFKLGDLYEQGEIGSNEDEI